MKKIKLSKLNVKEMPTNDLKKIKGGYDDGCSLSASASASLSYSYVEVDVEVEFEAEC
jgi:natural product precursor